MVIKPTRSREAENALEPAETMTHDELEATFAVARAPGMPEVQELFNRARSKVLEKMGFSRARTSRGPVSNLTMLLLILG